MMYGPSRISSASGQSTAVMPKRLVFGCCLKMTLPRGSLIEKVSGSSEAGFRFAFQRASAGPDGLSWLVDRLVARQQELRRALQAHRLRGDFAPVGEVGRDAQLALVLGPVGQEEARLAGALIVRREPGELHRLARAPIAQLDRYGNAGQRPGRFVVREQYTQGGVSAGQELVLAEQTQLVRRRRQPQAPDVPGPDRQRRHPRGQEADSEEAPAKAPLLPFRAVDAIQRRLYQPRGASTPGTFSRICSRFNAALRAAWQAAQVSQ